MRIIFEEDGFPRELLTTADFAAAIERQTLRPDSDITLYREGEPPAAHRARDVAELRPLFGLPDLNAPAEEFVTVPVAAVRPDDAEPVGVRWDDRMIVESAPPVGNQRWMAEEVKVVPQPTSVPLESASNPAIAPIIKYAVFDGRASRQEYWSYSLLLFLVLLVGFAFSSSVGAVILLACALPSIAVTCRRLHDISVRGWVMLIGIIPYIGSVILLVMMLLPGTAGTNRYGPDPRLR